MRKWVLPVLATLAVGVFVIPTLAGAARTPRKHKCSFNVTALVAQVKVKSGNPPVSGSATDAATVDGKLCGKRFRGAARTSNTYPTPGSFTSKAQAFGPRGSVKAKFSGTGKLNPDGSVSFSGSGKVTGGTGIYKRAIGSLSFTGTSPSGSTVATQHIKGKVKY
jgi:hypothetical protein